jgi:hypothetical protein
MKDKKSKLMTENELFYEVVIHQLMYQIECFMDLTKKQENIIKLSLQLAYKKGNKQGLKKEKKYKCPWCGKPKDDPSIICSCEIKDTYKPWED